MSMENCFIILALNLTPSPSPLHPLTPSLSPEWREGRVEPPFFSREKGGDEGSGGEGRIEIPFSPWEKGMG